MRYFKIKLEKSLCFADAALPALLAAENSLKALNKNDIGEVRSMKRPPPGVVYVIESICIVKGVKPNRVSLANYEYEFIFQPNVLVATTLKPAFALQTWSFCSVL